MYGLKLNFKNSEATQVTLFLVVAAAGCVWLLVSVGFKQQRKNVRTKTSPRSTPHVRPWFPTAIQSDV